MDLRLFEERDEREILELANRYAAFDGETSAADLAVTRYFRRGFWVAEENNRIVGYAYGYFREYPESVMERWHTSKVGYLASIAVDSDHQGKGVGESLAMMVISELGMAGADVIIVDCPSGAAIMVYTWLLLLLLRGIDAVRKFARKKR